MKRNRLDDLNRRISAFDFDYPNDTNKPAPILAQKLKTNDNSLKQHGMIYYFMF